MKRGGSEGGGVQGEGEEVSGRRVFGAGRGGGSIKRCDGLASFVISVTFPVLL